MEYILSSQGVHRVVSLPLCRMIQLLVLLLASVHVEHMLQVGSVQNVDMGIISYLQQILMGVKHAFATRKEP